MSWTIIPGDPQLRTSKSVVSQRSEVTTRRRQAIAAAGHEHLLSTTTVGLHNIRYTDSVGNVPESSWTLVASYPQLITIGRIVSYGRKVIVRCIADCEHDRRKAGDV